MDTLSAGAAGAAAAEVAEFAETASFDNGAEEELAGVAPVPNCPDMKTCAALASFDLMSCAAGLVWAVDSATGAGVADEDGADVDGDEVTEDDANAFPVTAAGAALPALLR